jgi:hypothetical protein
MGEQDHQSDHQRNKISAFAAAVTKGNDIAPEQRLHDEL